jgi:hypothetical protein
MKSNPISNSPKKARMDHWLAILLTFIFTLLISSCGFDVEDPTPPSPPVWVQKSLPDEWPERGIDAHESCGIYLEWESNPDVDVATYLIYRAEQFSTNDSLGDFVVLDQIENDRGNRLIYIDANVNFRVKYHYKIKAIDLANNTSEYSTSISYLLLPQINLGGMIPNGIHETLNTERRLQWQYSYGLEMENYCLTILNQKDEYITRIILTPDDYVNGNESWRIPQTITLKTNQLYKWRIDVGSNYVNEFETAASESPWAIFLYIGV